MNPLSRHPQASQTSDLIFPLGEKRIFLHCCCAPCVGGITEALLGAGFEVTMFFYNPNIHPREEYELRKQEQRRYALKRQIPFVEAPYDPETWMARIKGWEKEPERGKRCSICFDLRMEVTARYAHEHHFPVFATSLGISRWKDLDQVNSSGEKAAQPYPGLTYWDINWRKKGRSQRSSEIAREEGFYRQHYCGCVFSREAATTT